MGKGFNIYRQGLAFGARPFGTGRRAFGARPFGTGRGAFGARPFGTLHVRLSGA